VVTYSRFTLLFHVHQGQIPSCKKGPKARPHGRSLPISRSDSSWNPPPAISPRTKTHECTFRAVGFSSSAPLPVSDSCPSKIKGLQMLPRYYRARLLNKLLPPPLSPSPFFIAPEVASPSSDSDPSLSFAMSIGSRPCDRRRSMLKSLQ